MEEVMQRTLANNIRKARQAKDLTQDELAGMLGEYSVYVSAFECGIEIPSLKQLVRMADIFDCSIDWLLGREEKEKKEADVPYEELLDAFLALYNIFACIKTILAKSINEIDDAVLRNNEKPVTVLEKLIKSEVVTTDNEKGEEE